MELFIAGLVLGLVLGMLIMRQKIDSLEDLLMEQDEVITLQQRYIKQEDTRMTIAERARRLERHCLVCNRCEVMTQRGMVVVKIFDDQGKAVRVAYKDGESVDIQRAPAELLRPINTNNNEITFGGF